MSKTVKVRRRRKADISSEESERTTGGVEFTLDGKTTTDSKRTERTGGRDDGEFAALWEPNGVNEPRFAGSRTHHHGHPFIEHYPPRMYYHPYPTSDTHKGLLKAGAILSFVGAGFALLLSIYFLFMFGALVLSVPKETDSSMAPAMLIFIFLPLVMISGGIMSLVAGINAWKRRKWKTSLIISIIAAVLSFGQIWSILAAVFIGISRKAFRDEKETLYPTAPPYPRDPYEQYR